MSSNPATNLESIDTFFGYKLLDYVEPAEFFRLLKKYDIDENITKNKSILELYKLIPKKVFNKIFFDCVMFNHLKNIFIYNISVDKKKFKSEVIDILKEINNSSHIPEITKSFLKKEGFNLMTILGDQTKLGDKFVLGLEYVENEEFDQARMLFSHVVLTKSNKIIHNVCGLIVDFSKQKCLILLKNFTNLEKGHTPDLIEDLKITLPSYRDWIKKKFNSLVNFQSHNVDEVRLKMFKICKNFDDALLSEDRAFVTEKLESRVSKILNNINF